jgi:hypothetical protein
MSLDFVGFTAAGAGLAGTTLAGLGGVTLALALTLVLAVAFTLGVGFFGAATFFLATSCFLEATFFLGIVLRVTAFFFGAVFRVTLFRTATFRLAGLDFLADLLVFGITFPCNNSGNR